MACERAEGVARGGAGLGALDEPGRYEHQEPRSRWAREQRGGSVCRGSCSRDNAFANYGNDYVIGAWDSILDTAGHPG